MLSVSIPLDLQHPLLLPIFLFSLSQSSLCHSSLLFPCTSSSPLNSIFYLPSPTFHSSPHVRPPFLVLFTPIFLLLFFTTLPMYAPPLVVLTTPLPCTSLSSWPLHPSPFLHSFSPLCTLLLITSSFPANIPSGILLSSPPVRLPSSVFFFTYSLSYSSSFPSTCTSSSSTIHSSPRLIIIFVYTSSRKARISAPMSNQAEVW